MLFVSTFILFLRFFSFLFILFFCFIFIWCCLIIPLFISSYSWFCFVRFVIFFSSFFFFSFLFCKSHRNTDYLSVIFYLCHFLCWFVLLAFFSVTCTMFVFCVVVIFFCSRFSFPFYISGKLKFVDFYSCFVCDYSYHMYLYIYAAKKVRILASCVNRCLCILHMYALYTRRSIPFHHWYWCLFVVCKDLCMSCVRCWMHSKCVFWCGLVWATKI